LMRWLEETGPATNRSAWFELIVKPL
jgi:hypothetical protein